MVTKSKAGKAGQKKGRIKVGKLKLNKETVKNLTSSEQQKVKGGFAPQGNKYLSPQPCQAVGVVDTRVNCCVVGK